MTIKISLPFIFTFFLFDQLLCLHATCWTKGTVRLPFKVILSHALGGFLNAKTMTLVVLLHCRHLQHQLPLWLWFLEGGLLHLSPRLSKFFASHLLHFSALFYHQHRIAHLPTVYQHAHRLHHHLHGTTAFDAALTGWGMPEEAFLLATELLLLGGPGLTPVSLSKHTLDIALANKTGHVALEGGNSVDNEHSDHHLLHNKNFGAFHCLLDVYMSTCHGEGYPVCLGRQVPGQGEQGSSLRVRRTEQHGITRLTFSHDESTL